MSIQTRPKGLLDFLGLNAGDVVPSDLATTLLPTLDLKDLYLLGANPVTNVSATTGQNSVIAPAWLLDSPAAHIVPEGFYRFLMEYSAFVYGLTVQSVDIPALWIGLPSGGGVFQTAYVCTNGVDLVASGGLGTVANQSMNAMASPHWIPPGGSFGSANRVIIGGPVTTFSVQHVSRWVDLRI